MKLDDFISKNEDKTPPMTVRVIGLNGKITTSYHVPEGFQLEKYVGSLYPDAELMVHCSIKEFVVSVILNGSTDIFETYHGVFHWN